MATQAVSLGSLSYQSGPVDMVWSVCRRADPDQRHGTVGDLVPRVTPSDSHPVVGPRRQFPARPFPQT